MPHIKFIKPITITLITAEIVDGHMYMSEKKQEIKGGKIVSVLSIDQDGDFASIAFNEGIAYNVPLASFDTIVRGGSYVPPLPCCTKNIGE